MKNKKTVSDLTDEEIKEMSPKEIKRALRNTRKETNREMRKDMFREAPKYVSRGAMVGGTIGGLAGSFAKSPKSIMLGVLAGSAGGATSGLTASAFKGTIESGRKGLHYREIDAAKRVDKVRGESRWTKKARSRAERSGRGGNSGKFIERQDV